MSLTIQDYIGIGLGGFVLVWELLNLLGHPGNLIMINFALCTVCYFLEPNIDTFFQSVGKNHQSIKDIYIQTISQGKENSPLTPSFFWLFVVGLVMIFISGGVYGSVSNDSNGSSSTAPIPATADAPVE